jgi:hypothetical protein
MKNMAKPAKTQTITVKVNEQNPEPLELIAKSIIEISDAFKKIETGPLKRKTIVLLLRDVTGLPQRDINAILDAAPKLKDYYVKELKKPS